MIILNTVVITIIVQLLVFMSLYRFTHKYVTVKRMKDSINAVDLPIISIKSGDSRLNMIIDTGSDTNILNRYSIDKLKCDTIQEYSSFGCVGINGAGDQVVHKTVAQISLCEGHSDPCEFILMDMEESFKVVQNRTGIHVDGLLGSKFLMKYKASIDYEDEILKFKLK